MVKTRQILGVIVPYGVGVATCYLFGYWGAFGVNALEHIGISDIFKLSLFPMIIAAGSMAFGLALGIIAPHNNRGEGSWIKRLFLPKHPRVFSAVGLSLSLLSFLFCPEPLRWALAATFFTYGVVVSRNEPIVVRLLGSGIRPFVLLYFGPFLLVFAVFIGRQEAHHVKAGVGERVVDVVRTEYKVFSGHKAVFYLGALGDSRFFYETCTAETIAIDPSGKSIVFKARVTTPLDQPYGPAVSIGRTTAASKECLVSP